VQVAVHELGGSGVAMCGARDAIRRLARIAEHYTHVLVSHADAEGLFKELAALTTEITEPDTDLLALGLSQPPLPRVRVIRYPTTRSVRDALAPRPREAEGGMINAAELKAALAGAMIETRYQPIVRISDRLPVGLEALARLNHPDRGTILPDRFVPQIEDAGLAAELTRIVSAQAFADLNGPFLSQHDLRMSLNFPLDVLGATEALNILEEQREASAVPASRVIIELTESRPVSDFDGLRQSLNHLRERGYGVAIDDVNPNVPQLDVLLDLPFTCLKFDKDIVQPSGGDPSMLDFVKHYTAEAKRRGMYVVAEGVETEEIWQQMAAFGIDAAQGFLAARPLPVAAVPIWWDSWVGSQPTA